MTEPKDYLSLLDDIPANHSGPVFEQIHRATMIATQFLRDFGLYLPGGTKLPVHGEVKRHLLQMTNRALDTYYQTAKVAPKTVMANEVWGEDADELFTVCVTGLTEREADGYTAEIDMNLLYTGGQ